MMRKLVDNGIDVHFEKDDKEYCVSKDFELETYYIISNNGAMYVDKKLWDYVVQDTSYWEEIEKFIERLVDE